MDAARKPFRYRLAPLLRRDEWERDLLGGEMRRAHVLVEQAHQRWQTALSQVAAAEVQMRELHAQDRMIPLAPRQMLHEFIAQAHVTTATRLAEWRRANTLMEQVRQQLETKRVAVRTLEKHCERQRAEHEHEQERRSMGEADENWLTRETRR